MTVEAAPVPGVVLRCAGLRKVYGKPVVDRLHLELRAGELYALLGPNGAGKTTTLRMIAGLLAPDDGRIEINGVDLAAQPEGAKQHLAYLPDEPALYGKLTALEYLEFVAALWQMEAAAAQRRALALLDLLGLSAVASQRSEEYSRGMKQKLALAAALLHEPRLLMLDEPLTGLDAHAARLVKDMLRAHVAQGGSVLLTTHILEVAERLADRIGIIAAGRLVAEGSLPELRARGGRATDSLEDLFLRLTATP
jgi:ABC-2 type transport system ATP-binding protein